MNWSELLAVILPIGVAAAITYLYDWFKQGVGFLDKLPASLTWLHPVIVATLAFFGAKLIAFLGLTISGDPTQWTQSDLQATIMALLSYVFKLGKSAKEINARVG